MSCAAEKAAFMQALLYRQSSPYRSESRPSYQPLPARIRAYAQQESRQAPYSGGGGIHMPVLRMAGYTNLGYQRQPNISQSQQKYEAHQQHSLLDASYPLEGSTHAHIPGSILHQDQKGIGSNPDQNIMSMQENLEELISAAKQEMSLRQQR